MQSLNLSSDFLTSHGATFTAQEIAQQPEIWRQTDALLRSRRTEIEAFLAPILAQASVRIIFTGAGTSAHIGECIAPELLRRLNKRVEAIATTDLVAGPRDYFQRDVPTLLVSFSRSGGSPESVAAVVVADQCLTKCFHLVITCNGNGALFKRVQNRGGCFALLLPEQTHDKGFAMTASFTSMLWTALAVFTGIEAQSARLTAVSNSGQGVVEQLNTSIQTLANQDLDRVVFLGSRGLKALAAEAALKLLELTDGAVVAASNSPLGFRHGPKSIVNGKTLVLIFLSNDTLARKYDLDLLSELQRDGRVGELVVVDAQPPFPAAQNSAADPKRIERLLIPKMATASDTDLMFPFILCAQLYAFHRALKVGTTPDSPCVSGTVNRVVQGVTIHAL